MFSSFSQTVSERFQASLSLSQTVSERFSGRFGAPPRPFLNVFEPLPDCFGVSSGHSSFSETVSERLRLSQTVSDCCFQACPRPFLNLPDRFCVSPRPFLCAVEPLPDRFSSGPFLGEFEPLSDRFSPRPFLAVLPDLGPKPCSLNPCS